MKLRFSGAVTIAALLAAAAPAHAQDNRNDRAGRRTAAEARARAGAQSGGAPSVDSPNPVKRTWDFTRRFGIPQYASPADCADDAGAYDRFRSEFVNRVNLFLAGPGDAKKLMLERRNYVRQVLGSERDIARYLETFETTGKRGPDGYVPSPAQDLCRARTQRFAVLAIREGLHAMRRVYPDMAEVGPALAQADAALARMGNDAAVQRFVGANRAGSLAGVRLKPAVSRNSEWERGLRDGFARLVPGETILKLHLYSSGWYVHKNAVTSVPEYRQIGAWVATRRGDGTCWINGLDLWQTYTGGGSFDAGEYKLGQPPQQILCENL
ncbi:MAG: hypothetical protein ACKOPO_10135 [Novosphingobium sp.]